MNCLHCNISTHNPKFCSRSCAASYNNKLYPKRKLERKCAVCGEASKSYRHARCEKHDEEYKNSLFSRTSELTLGDYWNRESLVNLHRSSRNAHIRTLARYHFKHLAAKPCANCGYDKHVELCHIKSIRSFGPEAKLKEVNCLDNLIQLCPNCHWEFDRGLLSPLLESNRHS